MAKIYDFNLNEEECLDFAYDAVENGDVKKSLMYVHKALEINPDNTEANFYLASIYSDLNAFDFSNDVVFKILPKIKNARAIVFSYKKANRLSPFGENRFAWKLLCF